jgi:hypothetical protein
VRLDRKAVMFGRECGEGRLIGPALWFWCGGKALRMVGENREAVMFGRECGEGRLIGRECGEGRLIGPALWFWCGGKALRMVGENREAVMCLAVEDGVMGRVACGGKALDDAS